MIRLYDEQEQGTISFSPIVDEWHTYHARLLLHSKMWYHTVKLCPSHRLVNHGTSFPGQNSSATSNSEWSWFLYHCKQLTTLWHSSCLLISTRPNEIHFWVYSFTMFVNNSNFSAWHSSSWDFESISPIDSDQTGSYRPKPFHGYMGLYGNHLHPSVCREIARIQSFAWLVAPRLLRGVSKINIACYGHPKLSQVTK